jgi:N-acylneuraminate cytidylyltransferase
MINSKQNTIAIIPARGGSKGLPRKNIRPLAGKPLIVHTIEHALNAKSVNMVFVSTDDPEIAVISKAHGAEVVDRPKELAGDNATSESALLHTLNFVKSDRGIEPDFVVFLQCTSPVREPADIDGAIQTVVELKADSLLSVCRSHRFIWRDQENGFQSLNYDYRNRKMRQNLPPEYVENGSIYVFKPWVLRELDNRLGGKIAFYEMGHWESFEIDSLEDFEFCEWVISQKKRRKQISLLPSQIELLVLDFDGVFSDNRVIVDENGIESVICNRSDGFGISQIRQKGIHIIVLSTEKNNVVKVRCDKLGIECFQDIDKKIDFLKRFSSDENIDLKNVVYVGNDINDLECMVEAGCSIAVADAHPSVLSMADIVLETKGGYGAIREVCDMIIERNDLCLSL